MFARLFLLVLFALVAGCSGGSGAGSPGLATSPDPVLLVDGDAASTAHVSARLAVVALEGFDGSLTGNLLREHAVVTLASPEGSSSGLRLDAIPAGDYVALHLHFVPGSAVETRPDGTDAVLGFERLHDRLPIGRRALGSGATPWIVVGHAEQLEIDAVGGDRRVRHALWARIDEPHIVRDLEVRVLGVDRPNATAVAEVPALSNLIVDLDFNQSDLLVWDGIELSVDEFLDRVEEGTLLRVDALLAEWRTLQVIEAENLQGAVGPRQKTEILATLLDVRPEAGAFGEITLRVQLVRHGGGDLPSERPLDLTLRFDERTQVKLMRGRARWGETPPGTSRTRNGEISDLAADQVVKARWRGALDGRTATAERLDVVAPGLGDQVPRWFEGSITALDVPNDRFEIELAGSMVRETVDASGAVVVGTDPSGALGLLEIGDLLVGDVAAVLGVRGEDGSIRAELVRRR